MPLKASRAETQYQAQTWDKKFSAYKSAGFCPRCASQASWGHQIGFAIVQDVGDCCRGKTPPNASDRAVRWANHQPQVQA